MFAFVFRFLTLVVRSSSFLSQKQVTDVSLVLKDSDMELKYLSLLSWNSVLNGQKRQFIRCIIYRYIITETIFSLNSL